MDGLFRGHVEQAIGRQRASSALRARARRRSGSRSASSTSSGFTPLTRDMSRPELAEHDRGLRDDARTTSSRGPAAAW